MLVVQHFSDWDSWPEDVRDKLQRWNKEFRLSFRPAADSFTCGGGCGRDILSHSRGNAVVRDNPKRHGTMVCEDCLVALARHYKQPPALGYRGAIVQQTKHIAVLERMKQNLECKNAKLRRQIESEHMYTDRLEAAIDPKFLQAIKDDMRGKNRRPR